MYRISRDNGRIWSGISASKLSEESQYSPQHVRLGQRQAMTRALHNSQPSSASSYQQQFLESGTCCGVPQEQKPRLTAPMAWENSTLATQLVIGCYVALYRAKGVSFFGHKYLKPPLELFSESMFSEVTVVHWISLLFLLNRSSCK